MALADSVTLPGENPANTTTGITVSAEWLRQQTLFNEQLLAVVASLESIIQTRRL